MSVWESWQRHLGNPELTPEADGTWNPFRNGHARPAVVLAWVYAFDLDATATTSPGPIVLSKIIATDAKSMSYYALEVAPAAAQGARVPVCHCDVSALRCALSMPSASSIRLSKLESPFISCKIVHGTFFMASTAASRSASSPLPPFFSGGRM